MFTEENNDYWRIFSKIINADFLERKYWYSAQSIINYNGFKIIFDNYAHSTVSGRVTLDSFVTRVYCKFESNENLRFKMESDSFLNSFIAMLNRNKVKTKKGKLSKKFIITSKNKHIAQLFNESIVSKIICNGLQQLFIDSNEGIWGKELRENHFEIATYVNAYKISYTELLKIKDLFEEVIDTLLQHYNIKPLN